MCNEEPFHVEHIRVDETKSERRMMYDWAACMIRGGAGRFKPCFPEMTFTPMALSELCPSAGEYLASLPHRKRIGDFWANAVFPGVLETVKEFALAGYASWAPSESECEPILAIAVTSQDPQGISGMVDVPPEMLLFHEHRVIALIMEKIIEWK